jgi:hypothetical protein
MLKEDGQMQSTQIYELMPSEQPIIVEICTNKQK